MLTYINKKVIKIPKTKILTKILNFWEYGGKPHFPKFSINLLHAISGKKVLWTTTDTGAMTLHAHVALLTHSSSRANNKKDTNYK